MIPMKAMVLIVQLVILLVLNNFFYKEFKIFFFNIKILNNIYRMLNLLSKHLITSFRL